MSVQKLKASSENGGVSYSRDGFLCYTTTQFLPWKNVVYGHANTLAISSTTTNRPTSYFTVLTKAAQHFHRCLVAASFKFTSPTKQKRDRVAPTLNLSAIPHFVINSNITFIPLSFFPPHICSHKTDEINTSTNRLFSSRHLLSAAPRHSPH
ncbi:hypothetical protein PHYBLDRAFT_152162 [Phycomyces blakesleeanus NRRL 1555(-)]|uniref:Uncharacterized protein n=1 Tax=Phycomyces blakesleeanus (strain ATCC 8743b / DSM 1359 / FGSC 10004 / NBRC 33097 / NRRL 1555) TaxID=763407 RepID=A0A167JSH5_PHYB8|nr:hypothetical protein PHYBLDRAFT_152162 [Phycomyces blakesleeanus NRRL 1555(-)]OAD66617.1 hypothetical protein PHYBLDRAFT_152162 [Phycomyces blakesleeanus NRRL 1555(-)]|eukprot:XP_018284657.1 hypothetical protein PHYBLDRAFT_152162 [Phycomyces blakesleeanus NRRL 1555(-)]